MSHAYLVDKKSSFDIINKLQKKYYNIKKNQNEINLHDAYLGDFYQRNPKIDKGEQAFQNLTDLVFEN